MVKSYTMLFKALLLAFLFSKFSVQHELEDGQLSKKPKVIGGTETEIESFPYICQLNVNLAYACGCTIISDDVVVTSGSCTFMYKASDLSVRAGTSFPDSGGVVVNVTDIYEHPDFDYFTNDWDISVLRLMAPLPLGPAVSLIALPEDNVAWATGTVGTLVGWGSTANGGDLSYVLRNVSIPLIDWDTCNELYAGLSALTPRMMCATLDIGGKDFCDGDRGSPFVIDGLFAGFVSWGMGCGNPNYPGVYSRISVMRQFIRDVVGI